MENEEQFFDKCLERAIKMMRKYMPNKEKDFVRVEELALAVELFLIEVKK